MTEFEEFWKAYPRKTGIGAARTQWSNEIFFKAAKPDVMINAAKAYRDKMSGTEEKFIQKPVTFLRDQTYLDDDLQDYKEPEAREKLPDWQEKIAAVIGLQAVRSWFIGATLEGNKIELETDFRQRWVSDNYGIELKKLGYDV